MTVGYYKSLVLTALFGGLAYLANFFMLIIPNLTLAFFIVFLSGYLLGYRWGFVSGALGFFLISYFNPMGMAMIPILLGQIVFGGITGAGGGLARNIFPVKTKDWRTYLLYALWGLLLSGIYMSVVSFIDAVMYGPFRERFLVGLSFSILTIISNMIIFPIMTPVIKFTSELIEESSI